jgi:ribosomal-protein-alanine N-acetyltransferase
MDPVKYTLRSATRDDEFGISTLQNFRDRVHRHLDWRSPLDWLGQQPFWVLETGKSILAALAFPPDPPGVAWVRFFAIAPNLRLTETWKILFKKCRETFNEPHEETIVSVATQLWYADLLKQNGFTHHQDIVVLEWHNSSLKKREMPGDIKISTIEPYELEEVCHLDQASFDLIWQLSQDGLKAAYSQSAYATVAKLGKRIIGYQICSATMFSAHLARLAVSPELQGQGIGYLLVQDLLEYFTRKGLGLITVNTQHDNHSSLALYHKIGFRSADDSFPVYMYKGDD